MTIAVTIGKYGGFYFYRKNAARLCLGWVAITFYDFDIDKMFITLLENHD